MDDTSAIGLLTTQAKRLGFSGISPESLDAIDTDARTHGWSSPAARAAFYIVMGSFAKLLEPIEGWSTERIDVR